MLWQLKTVMERSDRCVGDISGMNKGHSTFAADLSGIPKCNSCKPAVDESGPISTKGNKSKVFEAPKYIQQRICHGAAGVPGHEHLVVATHCIDWAQGRLH